MAEQYDWDDTALLEAYDAAVKGKDGRKKSKRQRPTIVVTAAEEEEKPAIIPVTAAPHIDQLEDDPALQQLLQAYFNAGFALAQYLHNNDKS